MADRDDEDLGRHLHPGRRGILREADPEAHRRVLGAVGHRRRRRHLRRLLRLELRHRRGRLGRSGIASIVIIVMYFGMFFSIGEMSAAMPHTGGAYSFARAAMGPWGGFVTGFAETIEYVVHHRRGGATSRRATPTGRPASCSACRMPGWVWWIILYAIFVGSTRWGAEVSFRFALVVAIISVGILVLFGGARARQRRGRLRQAVRHRSRIDAAGPSTFLPFGSSAILFALPFAMWFFLGIEELPLAAEEAHNPSRDIPKAGIWGMISLVVCAAIVFFLNPASPGAAGAGQLRRAAARRLPRLPARTAGRRFCRRSRSSACSPACRASCSPTAATCTRCAAPATTRSCCR